MKQVDHRALARLFLQYPDRRFWRSSCHRGAFYIGHLLPDFNPFTYLRGIRQSHGMKGHDAAHRREYVLRASARLERKSRLGLWDFYRLGTLLHYTADAFTWVHNGGADRPMEEHRAYEKRLHVSFAALLVRRGRDPIVPTAYAREAYLTLWKDAEQSIADPVRDGEQILQACRELFSFVLWSVFLEKNKKRT